MEANHVFAKMFGYSLKEALGMDVSDFIAPASQDSLIKNMQSGYEKPYELLGQKKDGSLFTIEINAKNLLYQGHTYRVASIRDITERKKIELEREGLIQQLQKTLEEVNVLRGILPICASCKKIRDDKGYWNQIEAYIRDHSDTRFTHSICPDCAQKLYPNLKIKK